MSYMDVLYGPLSQWTNAAPPPTYTPTYTPQDLGYQNQNVVNNLYGSQGFGGQTAMYSGIGAAYGRAVPSLSPSIYQQPASYPAGAVQRGPDLPDLSYNPFAGGGGSVGGADAGQLEWLRVNDPASYEMLVGGGTSFNDRFNATPNTNVDPYLPSGGVPDLIRNGGYPSLDERLAPATYFPPTIRAPSSGGAPRDDALRALSPQRSGAIGGTDPGQLAWLAANDPEGYQMVISGSGSRDSIAGTMASMNTPIPTPQPRPYLQPQRAPPTSGPMSSAPFSSSLLGGGGQAQSWGAPASGSIGRYDSFMGPAEPEPLYNPFGDNSAWDQWYYRSQQSPTGAGNNPSMSVPRGIGYDPSQSGVPSTTTFDRRFDAASGLPPTQQYRSPQQWAPQINQATGQTQDVLKLIEDYMYDPNQRYNPHVMLPGSIGNTLGPSDRDYNSPFRNDIPGGG